MNIEIDQWLHHGHHLESSTNLAKVSQAITACLSKAEALTTMAAISDLDIGDRKILENYMWALYDLVKEAHFLHEKLVKSIHALS